MKKITKTELKYFKELDIVANELLKLISINGDKRERHWDGIIKKYKLENEKIKINNNTGEILYTGTKK